MSTVACSTESSWQPVRDLGALLAFRRSTLSTRSRRRMVWAGVLLAVLWSGGVSLYQRIKQRKEGWA